MNRSSHAATLLALCCGLAAAAAAAPRNTDVISSPVYLEPQQLVEVSDNRRMNLYCTGQGSPTVVFDSGLGDGMMVWAFVQPLIAAEVRACSYDRAGLGFSDPSPRPGTAANIVDDLHLLLQAARIAPPYVLAGHSLGGMNIKLFAETYFPEVAGLVFVDPSHEDLTERSWALDPPRAQRNAEFMRTLHRCLEAEPEQFIAGSELRRTCGTPPVADRLSPEIYALQFERTTRPGYMRAWISETDHVWTTSAEQLRAARRNLGDLPIVVLTHEPLPRRANESQAMSDAQNRVRAELHADIAGMSTRGVVRTVFDSGHYFQLDQPQDVAAAILEVVDAVRAE